MATKKNGKDKVLSYRVGVLAAVVALAIAIIVGGVILFGFGINRLANGEIALGAMETLGGVLLLSTIILGKD